MFIFSIDLLKTHDDVDVLNIFLFLFSDFAGIEMRRIILLVFVALSPILSLPVTKTTKQPVEEPADLPVNLFFKVIFRGEKY